MSRWFRFYSDAMRNPKVAKLSDKDFRLWVELLAVAAENDGVIPPLSDLKHLLRRRLDHLSTAVKRLISGSLIDPLEGGYEPHNWTKFQYKSDSSTERSRKHREKCNVAATPPDTDTDTETDKTPKAPRKRWVSKPDKISDQLWSDWKAHRKTIFTETALRGIEREAGKAGWSLDAAIRETIERGWQGFKAEWVKEKNNGRSNQGRSSTAETAQRVIERLGG